MGVWIAWCPLDALEAVACMLVNVLLPLAGSYGMLIRHVPVMLLKLPIMLWSIAPNFSLLCPNYAPEFKGK